MGVSRQGRRFSDRVRKLEIQAGDILLLLGPSERLPEVTSWLACLPLAERGLQVIKRDQIRLTVGVFAVAVTLASFGVLYLPVALACAAALMVLFNVVPLRQLYESVEWSVIVLLGSMIPIGIALEDKECTALIARVMIDLAGGLSPAIIHLRDSFPACRTRVCRRAWRRGLRSLRPAGAPPDCGSRGT